MARRVEDSPFDTTVRECKHSTKAEIAKRIDAVVRLRLQGAARHDIIRYASEQGWGITTTRQVENYISRADKVIADSLETDRKQLLAQHHARREMLYRTAVEDGDTRAALSVLQDECELLGLYPEKKEGAGGQITVNIFERVAVLQQQLQHGQQPAVVDAGVPQGAVLGDRGGEQVDQAHADGEADGIPAAS